jgi:hypothetical protein
MARGRPAIVGVVIGGIFAYAGYSVTNGAGPIPPEIGSAVMGIGALVAVLGIIAQVRAPDRPNLRENEQILDEWHPAQTPSILLIIAGVVATIGGGGLLYFTTTPYIYGIAIGGLGLIVFASGSTRYYKNSLTTYFLTTENAIYEYRLFQKNEKKVHLNEINGSQREDTRLERLVNAGSITLKAPDNHVSFRSVGKPQEVLREIEDKYR